MGTSRCETILVFLVRRELMISESLCENREEELSFLGLCSFSVLESPAVEPQEKRAKQMARISNRINGF